MKGHIRKRGKSWAIKVDLGRDPETGKRRTRWSTVHGTKREAETECARIISEISKGQAVDLTRQSVGSYLEDWLTNYAERNVSAKTFERYAEIVRKHLVPALGAHPLRKLAPVHIERYYTNAEKSGRRDGKGGLSKRTIKHHHRVLSQALKKAVKLRLLAYNPCDAVDPPRPVRTELRTLDRDETNRLLEAVRGRRIQIPVLLAVTTGMRRGEVLGLRWRDVDLDGGTLSVAQTLEQTKEGLAFKSPKTARSRRSISLGPSTVHALRQHRASQAKARLRAGPAYEDQDLVCAREDGNPMSPRDLSKAFSKLVARLGLRVRFHDLRHTHITHLLENGVHPKVAADRAGHASVAITLDVYSHVVPGLQEDAANRVDAWLSAADRE